MTTWGNIIRPTKTGHVVTFRNGAEWLVKYEHSGLSADTDMDALYNEYLTNGGYLCDLIEEGLGRCLRKRYEAR